MPLPALRSAVIALGLTALLAGACVSTSPPPAAPAGQAALIVVGEDGMGRQVCVSLGEAQSAGRALLESSGLPVIFDDRNAMGALVCSLDGLGCSYPAEACLCQCEQLGRCTYWAYFIRTPPGDWVYSAQGVSAQPVRPGELHAWVWLDASLPASAALDRLPQVEFEAICP